MKKLELLAPAQNLKCAISAINHGADAVYIGADNFGARYNAKNSLEDIEKLVNYAHIFNVKVYVTLNTILNDKELEECTKLIWKLYEIKVDAIIIQDFGLLNSNLPPIVLHSSTQCDNRTVDKIKFEENVGFKRTVLARELPLNKIEEISKNTTIELEHFIHGALCVCYSGQCYLSQYIGKRSANRGQCAQACRMKYSLVDEKNKIIAKNQYLLSLKDNNLSKHLDKLIKAGITSFKIEGRLKDENYIKNTVLFYHKLLKNHPRQSFGEIKEDFTPNPDKTFNRGFCDDYLFNKKDNIYNFTTPKSMGEYIGTIISSNEKSFVLKPNNKTQEIINQDGLCFVQNNELMGCLVNNCEKTKDGYKVYPNKQVLLKKGDKIYRNIDTKFNKTLENSKTTRKLEASITVEENKLSIIDINNHKAEILFEFEEYANNQEKMKENFVKSLSKTQDTPFEIKKIEFKTEKLPFLAISKINELRRELTENLVQKILSQYRVKKSKKIDIAEFPIQEGNYKLNIHNEKAKEFLEICGCKIKEKSFEETNDKRNKELMRTKHCLRRAFLGCNSQDTLFLVDKVGEKFPLKFDCKNCEMIILSPYI